jgi:hypothetical protein
MEALIWSQFIGEQLLVHMAAQKQPATGQTSSGRKTKVVYMNGTGTEAGPS